MAKLSADQLIDGFKELSLIELTDFVKKFEEVFEVTAAVPVAAAAAPAAGGGDAAPAEEKDSFDVVLDAAGDKKIQVIKVGRELTGLGLKEAKEAVDNAPTTLKEAASKEDAEAMKAKLEDVGAAVALK